MQQPAAASEAGRNRRPWWLSRSEWAIRMMRLPVSADPPDAPGVLMIQIDGLGRAIAEEAMASGHMPTLARLRDGEGFRLADFYAGLPASTPAVQGELFYGVRTAVPAFSFIDRKTGEERRMYDPDAAKAVEDRLAGEGDGLLAGGSAYSDIYTGGAAEAHFCAASLGVSDLAKSANPWAFFALLLSNMVTVFRTLVLGILEIGLALGDAVRGMFAKGELWQELKFVPTRVAIAVLMRDWIALAAGIDLARGLPIVHVNFLGYDEQAHRRGPNSAFARWSLKGIDAAVGRLVRASRRSPRRHYRVFVYSDHGQLAVQPYPEVTGRSIERAVADVFARAGKGGVPDGTLTPPVRDRERGEQAGRVGYLSDNRWQRLRQALPLGAAPMPAPVRVTAMGPVGHVYANQPLSRDEWLVLGAALADQAAVPMVLARDPRGGVAAWIGAERSYRLPDDADAVLGPRHPFAEAVAADLMALCVHPDAGDFVLIGWAPGADRPAVTFPYEHGAHAGPSPEELGGFALLPPGHEAPSSGVLRPEDLRVRIHAALKSEGAPLAGAEAVG